MGWTLIQDPIRVRSLGCSGPGYRVLAAWKRPKDFIVKKHFDVWIPALAPSHRLWELYASKNVPWTEFSARYSQELNAPSTQDILKPLALLSFRRPVVLLCECSNHLRCPTAILAKALAQCRENGNFVLSQQFSRTMRGPR
ncbi:MAG: DUF488 family protein [Elusimicrobia bacterium]|nr:DUF488 family protein [Elusimicrobiota bacterium]